MEIDTRCVGRNLLRYAVDAKLEPSSRPLPFVRGARLVMASTGDDPTVRPPLNLRAQPSRRVFFAGRVYVERRPAGWTRFSEVTNAPLAARPACGTRWRLRRPSSWTRSTDFANAPRTGASCSSDALNLKDATRGHPFAVPFWKMASFLASKAMFGGGGVGRGLFGLCVQRNASLLCFS